MSFAHNLRRLLGLAWPVFVGQGAVLLSSTVDRLMMGRAGPEDLAALPLVAYVFRQHRQG